MSYRVGLEHKVARLTVRVCGEELPSEAWTKPQWRRWIIDQRRSRTAAERELPLVAGVVAPTVCAYVPVGSEPGTVEFLDRLRAAGATVLLPIARAPGPLDWARYDGELVPAPFRLREPPGPRLGIEAVAAADVVLVPALAVDRRGVRLGRGAGHYDRTLARAGGRLIAVVFDDEVVEQLPAEPHDVRVGWALTPGGGLFELGT